MSVDESTFITLYESQKEYLNVWGNIIKEQLTKELLTKGRDVNSFLKIPMYVRIKDNKSIISKAFYRNKNYSDAINDITDKVGLRLVVLLLEDIETIKEIVENNKLWDFSKDKDFEDERTNEPATFNYQSVHYILRNKNGINVNNITIPKNTPCEIQIRTLLQHAYSELTHDTVYKPNKKAEPEVYRLVARSMAMIETTDNIFEEVIKKMNTKNDNINRLLPILKKEYEKNFTADFQESLNNIILDAYSEEIEEINIQDFMKFIGEYDFLLKSKIKQKHEKNLLFRQPIILLIYYLVNIKRTLVKRKWPLTEDILKPIYTSMGSSFDD